MRGCGRAAIKHLGGSTVSNAFGGWLVDPKTGTAHYVLGGKCLCGAAVKKFGGPPERKPVTTGNGGFGGYATLLCVDCVDKNVNRWRKKGGSSDAVPSKPQREFWWRQPRFRKK